MGLANIAAKVGFFDRAKSYLLRALSLDKYDYNKDRVSEIAKKYGVYYWFWEKWKIRS